MEIFLEKSLLLSKSIFPEMDGKELPRAVVVNGPGTCSHGDMPWFQDDIQPGFLSGTAYSPVFLNDLPVGTRYEDEDAEYCFLSDIFPGDNNLPPSEQAFQTFENIRKALELNSMRFFHVVRTWFYLDKLYDWYSLFNEVRTGFFEKQGVFGHLVPASTGIGAGNSRGSLLVAHVLAVKPKHPGVCIFAVPSPLQGEATMYKSSFSRAVEIRFPAHRRLFISGTASIDRDGNSIHLADIDCQIETTMEVVGQIIRSRQMNWSDAVRAIAYFKDMKHVNKLGDYCRKNQIPPFPVHSVQSDICRPELLFELELDLAVFMH
ncbi:MAG: RidA family protein [Mangrovibacterium sp.]|nr:RidA family protein [Mangrovibacterium sp.]